MGEQRGGASVPANTVVVATGNAHKVVEIEAILSEAMPGTRFVTLKSLGDFPDPEETGETFEENAFIKAQAAHDATGLPAVADDSGLEVDALGGAPGVRSARYAGEPSSTPANNALLLKNLDGVRNRAARFVCAVALVDPAGREHVVRGECPGRIATEPSGAGGFGYDPLFIPDGHAVSFADLGEAAKNAISHRARALAAAKRLLAGS